MGTSTSHSSPDGKRWQALKRQYQRPGLDITAIVEKLAYAAGATLKAGLSEPGPATGLLYTIRGPCGEWDTLRDELSRAGHQSIWSELALRALAQVTGTDEGVARAVDYYGLLLGESGRYLVGRDIVPAVDHGASIVDLVTATDVVADRLRSFTAMPTVRVPLEQGAATILRLPAAARQRQLITAQRTLRNATTAACRLCVQQAA